MFISLQMPKLDENKIVIAHSLGCLTVLHYLTAHFSQR
ncbi:MULTISPECIES: alpha/beta hydrolase [unclassified Acinetobacter]